LTVSIFVAYPLSLVKKNIIIKKVCVGVH
jgi:hypothetical protein